VPDDADLTASQRWQRREQRRRSQRERMVKHGASLRRVYAAAIRKRLHTKKRQT
jgi:hypothetical protein